MQKQKILIIDDDQDDLDIMSGAICNQETCLLSSPMQLMAYLEHLHQGSALPSLIITDYFMPGYSAPEIIQRLKADSRFAHIPVMVYSTSDFEPLVKQCLNLGAADFMIKPDHIEGYDQIASQVNQFCSKLKAA
jgi:CheY-like chemotaxis protein